jgi:carbon monoxide dehydrogenase subunit G
MSIELRSVEQVHVRASITDTWSFIRDIRNWAAAMPGYKSFVPLTQDDSQWTIAAKIGPISRLVELEVNVRRWQEPMEVDFDLTGKNEPFRGSGSYRAQPNGDGTLISLSVVLEPGGPMAKMIGMLAGPVMRQGAKDFTLQLGRSIEASACPPTSGVTPSRPATVRERVSELFSSCRGRLLGRTASAGRGQ